MSGEIDQFRPSNFFKRPLRILWLWNLITSLLDRIRDRAVVICKINYTIFH